MYDADKTGRVDYALESAGKWKLLGSMTMVFHDDDPLINCTQEDRSLVRVARKSTI